MAMYIKIATYIKLHFKAILESYSFYIHIFSVFLMFSVCIFVLIKYKIILDCLIHYRFQYSIKLYYIMLNETQIFINI